MTGSTMMKPTRPEMVVELVNEQSRWPINEQRLCDSARMVLEEEGWKHAEISIAVVDDEAIHQVNRQFLNHDEPTDVISFVLDQHDDFLSGEIVISADTAARRAADFEWTINDELLLYVIHGALHLTGFDDLEPAARAVMREREQHYLSRFDLKPRYDELQDLEKSS